eukprot:scaffold325219_cov68-Tisochrysis_lutea.AAC.2
MASARARASSRVISARRLPSSFPAASQARSHFAQCAADTGSASSTQIRLFAVVGFSAHDAASTLALFMPRDNKEPESGAFASPALPRLAFGGDETEGAPNPWLASDKGIPGLLRCCLRRRFFLALALSGLPLELVRVDARVAWSAGAAADSASIGSTSVSCSRLSVSSALHDRRAWTASGLAAIVLLIIPTATSGAGSMRRICSQHSGKHQMVPSGAAAPPWYFFGCSGSDPSNESSWPIGSMIRT